MTELETIQRAQMFMDKLAKGIDPINDTPVPDDDAINNVRLSKCFAFVSSVLQRVIENGGSSQSAPVSSEKKVFDLPELRKKEFVFSDEPIPVSEIARRINALIDMDTMQKITYQQIRAWLAASGILEDGAYADSADRL